MNNTGKTKKFIKKAPIKNSLSTPKERGNRIRKLRNIANLSRKELCAFGQINEITYKSWELGKYGGLPLDGAKKLSKLFKEAGVLCEPEWILYCEGAKPLLLTLPTVSNDLPSSELINEQTIENEFLLIKQSFPTANIFKISKTTFDPFVNKNDYIVSIPISMNKIEAGKLYLLKIKTRKLPQVCIIESNTNNMLSYTVSPDKVSMKIIESSKIEKIESVIRIIKTI